MGTGDAGHFYRFPRVGTSGKEQRQGAHHSCRQWAASLVATGLVHIYHSHFISTAFDSFGFPVLFH